LGYRERFLSRIRLAHRLLRLGVRNAVQVDSRTILVHVNKRFYELNITTGEICPGFVPEVGVRALNVSIISGVAGFDDSIVFGGYVRNGAKRPVNVYRRVSLSEWQVVYTFEQGLVNHVHNIIPDRENGCAWIFTGDFDEAATIWRATDNFRKVEKVFRGDQMYRGCTGFAVNGGVLYATDTPFARNSIRFLHATADGKGWESRHVHDISGSCIYGCEVNDKYVFSTVVEADGRNETLLRLLFGWKKGPGIEDYYSRVYVGTMEEGFTDIYKVRKDMAPFIFQSSTLRFPSGNVETGFIIAEHVATNKYDGSAIAIPVLTGKE
jgi:hypothetical protein